MGWIGEGNHPGAASGRGWN
uniref:Uncharacterized protein n=1 Tax=Arundo donax TaxID=35708 RepID=A0A0A9GYJ3_ARUDO